MTYINNRAKMTRFKVMNGFQVNIKFSFRGGCCVNINDLMPLRTSEAQEDCSSRRLCNSNWKYVNAEV